MKRTTTLNELKGLIKRYWDKDTKMWVVSDYYIDLCDNRKIHILMDEFLKTLVSRSYYDQFYILTDKKWKEELQNQSQFQLQGVGINHLKKL